MPNPRPIPGPERLRLESLLLAEATRIKDQACLLGNLDEEVLGLALSVYPDLRDLLCWLSQPTSRLDGLTPLSALGSEAGRKAVVVWMEQVVNGGYM